jgi:hypothetical protein
MIHFSYLPPTHHAGGRGKAVILPHSMLPIISRPTAMPVSDSSSSLAASAAVLLVLLPPVGTAQPVRAATLAALQGLQLQLGSACRVLTVDEGSHPVVVQSFAPVDLPAFVLVRHGVELWRRQGLPEGETIVAELLSKLAP